MKHFKSIAIVLEKFKTLANFSQIILRLYKLSIVLEYFISINNDSQGASYSNIIKKQGLRI